MQRLVYDILAAYVQNTYLWKEDTDTEVASMGL